MTFAIYGESSGYVHLVSETSREKAVHSFLADLATVGVTIDQIYNVYAVNGRDEDKDLEDFIEELITEASK